MNAQPSTMAAALLRMSIAEFAPSCEAGTDGVCGAASAWIVWSADGSHGAQFACDTHKTSIEEALSRTHIGVSADIFRALKLQT